MYTLGPLVLVKPITICAPHAPPPLYTTLSLSRLPPSMALPLLSVHDPHGATSTHGPFAVVAGPCPRHHSWPLPMPPRLAPARATTAGPCPRRHSWPLPTPPWVAPARTTTTGPCLHHHGWPLPALPRLVPARAAMAGPCPRHHGWPLPAPPWLAPVHATTAAFVLHTASPALYFCILHPRTAPHGVDTVSRPFLVLSLCLAPFSFCTYYTNSALSKYFCHDPLWKDTMPTVLFRCPSCLFSSEAPPISIHKTMRSVCKSKDNGQAG